MAEVTTPAEQTLRELSAQEFIDILNQNNKTKQYESFYRGWRLYEKAIVFKNVKITGSIVTNSELKNVSLPVIIIDSEFLCDISLSEMIFSFDFVIDGECKFNGLMFHKVYFSGNFTIFDGIFSDKVIINGSRFRGNFMVFGKDLMQGLWVNHAIFEDSFCLVAGKLAKLIIRGGYFLKKITIEDVKIEEIQINSEMPLYINIIELSLKDNSLFKSFQLLSGRKCNINCITFKNAVIFAEQSIQIVGVNANQIEYNNVLNYGNISLSAVDTLQEFTAVVDENKEDGFYKVDVMLKVDSNESELNIKNSDLGKTTFIGCDFSNANFCIESSKITELFVTGTKLPVKLIHKNPEQRRIGYGQLKKVYENRGDSVEANRYLGREMWAYLMQLVTDSDSLPKMRFRRLRNIPEIINISLNFLSSWFGHSWFQAFLTTLTVSGLFYWRYCHALGYEYDSNGGAEFQHLMSYFLEFINPIHDADYIAKELAKSRGLDEEKYFVPGKARIIEGLSRIFIAYFIYQLIQAFRKHGKKGE